MSRKISQIGIDLIKSFEGCRLESYKPVKTEVNFTIGWGHTDAGVYSGMRITQEQADNLLVTDLVKYESYVNDKAVVPVIDSLNQYQFDALVSFCYNCGVGNLKTLCKDRTVKQIGDSIEKYNKAGGNVLLGLIRRRKAETELYSKDYFVENELNKTILIINGVVTDGIIHKDGYNYISAQALKKLNLIVEWNNSKKTLSVWDKK